MIKLLIASILGISTALLPIKAIAAERITFNISPFGQFQVRVEDLEAFIATGEISRELAYYLNRLPEERVKQIPELLSTPLEFNPLTIAKFSNSTIGETVIRNFGKGIRTRTNRNGFFALRGAIIAAAFDREGLTVINLLKKFPLKTIHVDISILDRYIEQGEEILENRREIDQLFFTKVNDRKLSVANSLIELGKFDWQQQTLTYNNPRHSQLGNFDLYLPKKDFAPLIVISHGVASNRKTFSYLGEHLASHGFAVAIAEHDDISLNKFDNFLSGKEAFPEPNNLIDRPLDIKAILDRLEAESQNNPLLKNKINLEQIGIIGHSFGGYTALALAGGKLIVGKNSAKCQTDNFQNVLLDLSSLANCTFNQISEVDRSLKDPRIKAAIAVNPMGRIFGEEGMKFIDIPIAIVSGTNDLIMPPVAEQIEPFTWLDRDLDKYLILVKPGTHFSFLREGLGVLPVPEGVVGISPTEAYPTIKIVATSFFETYLKQQSNLEKYLEPQQLDIPDYDAFQISIINSILNLEIKQLLLEK